MFAEHREIWKSFGRLLLTIGGLKTQESNFNEFGGMLKDWLPVQLQRLSKIFEKPLR